MARARRMRDEQWLFDRLIRSGGPDFYWPMTEETLCTVGMDGSGDIHAVRGSIKINFPDLEVWEMNETCALDVADRGGITLEEVGEIMNLTRERVRQVETAGLSKLSALRDVERLKDYIG